MIKKFLQCFLVFSMVCAITGCSAVHSIKQKNQAKKDAIQQKKDLFQQLKSDIANKVLRHGADTESVKSRYGAPDDVFYSGSSVSSMQVWTYNISKDKLAETRIDAIILYFENDKLVNWKY